MSLDHSFELSTHLTPDEVMKLLAQRLDFKWGDKKSLYGSHLWIAAGKMTSRERETMEQVFRFFPDISVYFRVQHEEDNEYEIGIRYMLRGVMCLLEYGSDAVLLFNGEHLLFQRIGGKLVLNSNYGNWADGFRLLDEITLPYEMRPFPTPIL